MPVKIAGVKKGSIASLHGIEPDHEIISVNGHNINDLLDYKFYCTDNQLAVKLLTPSGKGYSIRIEKQEDEDLGLEFDSYLMDSQRSCRNKCIFCFIDQLPKGMRKSLYFKDDDSRLSFLFGNYITLTNMSDSDIERIVKMRLSPVNISVHTTNPALRNMMMGNKEAGASLRHIETLSRAGIDINCQIVLCPGINDGHELIKSLNDLSEFYPSVRSISVVPVGLTKYRQGLMHLKAYDKQSAAEVIDTVEGFGSMFLKKHGTRLCYPADEFYIKAQRPIPRAGFYEEYPQLENGVGMLALMRSQFKEALNCSDNIERGFTSTVVTGIATYPFIVSLVDEARKKCHNLSCRVVAVKNNFFGSSIDVAGLLTARDVIEQLKGKAQGTLLLPSCMLRSQGDLFLDDLTPYDIEDALGVPVKIVPLDGLKFFVAITGG